jgi:hypothetical protein
MITIDTIENISPNSTVWDQGKGAVSGFGVRRQKGDAVAYILKYRTADGRQRWTTIGRHGAPLTPHMARNEAKKILGEVVKGGDPAGAKQEARKATTVAELCDLYLEAAKAGRILTRRKAVKRPSLVRSSATRDASKDTSSRSWAN